MKIFLLSAFTFLIFTCSNNSKSNQQNIADSTNKNAPSKKNSTCVKPIKDPNNPKPMALMMRMMAENADSMRVQLLRGEKLSSEKYPFLRFYLAEPTDTSVLKMQFFENARLFQESYTSLFKNSNQKQLYNVVVGKCINCHEMYCNGPLKRIRKMYIDM